MPRFALTKDGQVLKNRFEEPIITGYQDDQPDGDGWLPVQKDELGPLAKGTYRMPPRLEVQGSVVRLIYDVRQIKS
jgi:hypothetical protein